MNLRQLIVAYDEMVSELMAELKVAEQPTVADVATIQVQYNESNGNDPYSFIPSAKPETLPVPLSEILANPEINLIKPIKPINKKIDLQEKAGSGEGLQPIHTAWLGGNLTDETRWENLKKLKELNPETEIVLWVHQLYEPIDANNPMVQRCQELGVHVIPIEKVFGRHLPNPNHIPDLSQMDTWEMYIEGMFKSMYGWASDIIRYNYLYMYGGVHCDLDTKPIAAIENMAIPTDKNIYIYRSLAGNYINDPLAANKFCHEIANVIKEVHRVAGLQYKDAIPAFTKRKQNRQDRTVKYENNYYNLNFGEHEFQFPTIVDLLRDYTILTTGASSLIAQFSQTALDEHLFPSGYFKQQCLNAWINTDLLLKHFKGSKEEAIKLVLTNILSDLRHEPRLLDIDRYSGICKHFGIGDMVFACLLAEPHRQKIQQVKYANIFNSCLSADTINSLFNRDNFPALGINQANPTNVDLEYYAKMLEYSSNFELLKYLQKNYNLPDNILNKIFSFSFNKVFGREEILFVDYIKNELLKGKLTIDPVKITHDIMASGNLVGLKYALQHFLDINATNKLGDYILNELENIHKNSVRLTELEKQIIISTMVELILENKLYDSSAYTKIASIIGFNDREQFISLAEILSQRISDFNAVSPNGETVLHQAIQHGDIKIIEYLLQKGASTIICNTNGENAHMLALRMMSEHIDEQQKQKYRDIYNMLLQHNLANDQNPNFTLPKPSYNHARNGVLDLAKIMAEVKTAVLNIINTHDELSNNSNIKIINEIVVKHVTNLEEAFRLIIKDADKLNAPNKEKLDYIFTKLAATLEKKMYKMIVEINDDLAKYLPVPETDMGDDDKNYANSQNNDVEENNEVLKNNEDENEEEEESNADIELITDAIISCTENANFSQKLQQLMQPYTAVPLMHLLTLPNYEDYFWAANDKMVNDIKTLLNKAPAETYFITYNEMANNKIVTVSIHHKLDDGQWHTESIPAATIQAYFNKLSIKEGMGPIHIYASAFLTQKHQEQFPSEPTFNPTNKTSKVTSLSNHSPFLFHSRKDTDETPREQEGNVQFKPTLPNMS